MFYTKAKHYAFKCQDTLRIDSTGAGWGISISCTTHEGKGSEDRVMYQAKARFLSIHSISNVICFPNIRN